MNSSTATSCPWRAECLLLLRRWLLCTDLDQSAIWQRLAEELDDAVAYHAIDLRNHRGHTAHVCGGYHRRFFGNPAVHREIGQPVGLAVLPAQHVLDLKVVELIEHLHRAAV